MMRDLLIEAAHDIEQAVHHEYGYPDVHPAMQWKYDRDMEIVSRLRATADSLESPPRPEPVAWVAPHNTLYLFDGYEFTIITRRPDGKLSFSGGDDMPENFDDEVGAAGIYRFVGSVHSAEGWTSEQCEAAGIPSDASNYSEWWNGHMEDATLADVAHVFGIPHPGAAAGAEVVERLRKQLERVVGEHHAPNDCYATGPLTGDSFVDLVTCPSCEALALLKEVDRG